MSRVRRLRLSDRIPSAAARDGGPRASRFFVMVDLRGALYVTLVVLSTSLACGREVLSRAEEPISAPWVPFVAKYVQKITGSTLGGPYTGEASGVYVRDSHGSWFRRATVSSKRSILPVVGQTDTAFLYDRTNHRLYFLDFTRKTIRVQKVDGGDQPLFGDKPMSPQAFEQSHSQDKFLGKQTISGVDCEGYAIHDSRHKGKYVSEVWYAPSLNYLVIESKSGFPDTQEVTTLVEEIQAGKEPDPQYFRLPDGFKIAK